MYCVLGSFYLSFDIFQREADILILIHKEITMWLPGVCVCMRACVVCACVLCV